MADVEEQAGLIEQARIAWPNWRIWRSSMDGDWHARRDDPDDGQFVAVAMSPRRFSVHGATPIELILRIGMQERIDEELLIAAAGDE